MKRLLKQPFALLLAAIARGILTKYRPAIVMVTGSVGKTSTKDAVAAALSNTFYLRASEKSYNSEFGVPLTIIGAKNAWTNPLAWLGVFGEALALLLFPSHYPKLLVLEVGADRPGDLERILKIATPDVVVVTQLPDVPVHVEAYASTKAVREEEFAPAYALPHGAPLVICADDAYSMVLAKELHTHVRTFGTANDAQVRIRNIRPLVEDERPCGMQAEASINGTEHTLSVVGAFGYAQLLAPAAALAVADALNVPLPEAFAGLKDSYTPPAGRARLLRGIKGTTIIDDSYNASPAAVEEVLRSLELLPAGRTVAVLGDMLELGRYSSEQHERIGRIAAEHADIVIAVGERSRSIAEAARAAGMQEDAIRTFDTAIEAAAALKEIIETGDAIVVKGSQSMRMERVVEALLADAADTHFLVRQEKEWKQRP